MTTSVVWIVIGLARHQGIHQLSAVGTVLFGGILVTSLVDPNLDAWLKDYSGTISDAALVLTARVGMAVKHPFTLHYAKLSVDEVQWEHNPDFRAGVLAVSQAITGVWALSFAIGLACDFLQNATRLRWRHPVRALASEPGAREGEAVGRRRWVRSLRPRTGRVCGSTAPRSLMPR